MPGQKRTGHETNALVLDIKDNKMSSLDLTEYHMSPLACDKITIALRKNSSVESVYLNNCCIGDNGVAKFCDVLRHSSSIELLCLFGNSVGAHGVESLCFALEQNTVLTSLDLRGNDVEDDGARALGDLLRKNSAIQSLDIGSNPAITSQGRNRHTRNAAFKVICVRCRCISGWFEGELDHPAFGNFCRAILIHHPNTTSAQSERQSS